MSIDGDGMWWAVKLFQLNDGKMSKVGTELNQKTIYWDVLFGNGLQFRLRSTVEARSCLEMQRIR